MKLTVVDVFVQTQAVLRASSPLLFHHFSPFSSYRHTYTSFIHPRITLLCEYGKRISHVDKQ